jgi:hypothetical protein
MSNQMMIENSKSKIRSSLGPGGFNKSFLCALAPLRDKIRANLCKSVTEIMKNEANLNSPKLTANPYDRDVYNDFNPKTKIGTKPNKANFRELKKRRAQATRQENKIMRNEPNFKTANFHKNSVFNTINPKNHRFSEASAKQNEPKANPI